MSGIGRVGPHCGHLRAFDRDALNTRYRTLNNDSHIYWSTQDQRELWRADETAIVIVDMWDRHWCPSATERGQALATFINETITAARLKGVQIIHAPSECDDYYASNPSRLWVLALPNITMPSPLPHSEPALPIGFADGGCDVGGVQPYKAWTRETDLITIWPEDAIIEDSDGGQTLWNLIYWLGLKHLLYVGVHENMCILDRSFAIRRAVSWGVDVAIVREAVDTMYDPSQPPYIEHEASVALMTAFVESFWAKSISVYDLLN